MKFKYIPAILFTALLSTSCVSSKVFKQLDSKYQDVLSENQRLQEENQGLLQAKNELDAQNGRLDTDLEAAQRALREAERDLDLTRKNHQSLKESYDMMLKDNSSLMAESAQQNRQLLQALEEKEQELKLREEKVNELKRLIAEKENAMNNLKNSLKQALVGFEGNGLTVEQKNGKVYVSMENKLLFRSGSYNVDSRGKMAIQELTKVLAQNDNIDVLIEGHTDDVPYRGSGQLKDNWDLSVKRATSIVKIMLENSSMSASRVTAAGRGKYLPVVANNSAENKAKNRRIEVILTPDLSNIEELLQ